MKENLHCVDEGIGFETESIVEVSAFEQSCKSSDVWTLDIL